MKIHLDTEVIGKTLAHHQAQATGLFGKWSAEFHIKNNVLTGVTITLSAHPGGDRGKVQG